MALVLGKTKDALRSATGVTETQSEEAAEELADLYVRLLRLETKLNVILGLSITTLAAIGMILLEQALR